MTVAADIPLICDAPRRRIVILTVPGYLSIEQREGLRAAWNAAIASPTAEQLFVLEGGVTVQEIGGYAEGWPDAEFCAA